MAQVLGLGGVEASHRFVPVCSHNHPEVDRIWMMLGTYSTSFKDHIP